MVNCIKDVLPLQSLQLLNTSEVPGLLSAGDTEIKDILSTDC